eukprot:4318073-Prymnesium_polylepis.1
MREAAAARDDARPIAHTRAGLVDHDVAPVHHLLEQPEEAGLVVAQTDLQLFLTDALDLDRPTGERREQDALAELLRALVFEHAVPASLAASERASEREADGLLRETKTWWCQAAWPGGAGTGAGGRWPMLSPEAVSGDYACPA